MAILITGGAGYIGSHTCVELLDSNEEIVVLDNFGNSSIQAIRRIEQISGKTFPFYEGNILSTDFLDKVFSENNIDSVIHFAALKAVGESTEMPLEYYENNVSGTLMLLKTMEKHSVNDLVFSSSATVYGDPSSNPITEDFPRSANNPYGRTKLMTEEILTDLSRSNWKISLLRYFNPIGAHRSGLIGEDPKGIPNNLLPFILKVANKEIGKLRIFGNDYPTPDGTGIRDYIHVVDLAKAHLKTIRFLRKQNYGITTFNLGTGKAHSVLELVHEFEKVTKSLIPYVFVDRRNGDISECWADPSKANSQLQWCCEHTLETMIRDSWKWNTLNPKGYK
jgi:UDP-glucose 4-epimerase